MLSLILCFRRVTVTSPRFFTDDSTPYSEWIGKSSSSSDIGVAPNRLVNSNFTAHALFNNVVQVAPGLSDTSPTTLALVESNEVAPHITRTLHYIVYCQVAPGIHLHGQSSKMTSPLIQVLMIVCSAAASLPRSGCIHPMSTGTLSHTSMVRKQMFEKNIALIIAKFKMVTDDDLHVMIKHRPSHLLPLTQHTTRGNTIDGTSIAGTVTLDLHCKPGLGQPVTPTSRCTAPRWYWPRGQLVSQRGLPRNHSTIPPRTDTSRCAATPGSRLSSRRSDYGVTPLYPHYKSRHSSARDPSLPVLISTLTVDYSVHLVRQLDLSRPDVSWSILPPGRPIKCSGCNWPDTCSYLDIVGYSLLKGLKSNTVSIAYPRVTCHPNPPPLGVSVSHSHMSHKQQNKLMKTYNGNIQKTIDVVFQNIPNFTPAEDIEINIANLLHFYKHPAVLFLGEVDVEKVKLCVPKDYTLVSGKLKNAKKIRNSALISKNYVFRDISPNLDVPVVGIEIGKWKLFSVYREWAKEGDQSTRDLEFQIERFKTLVEFWTKQKGRCCFLGDFNFDPRPNVSQHQENLEKIRELVADEILQRGWLQIIDNPTRAQGRCTPAILDHIYTRHPNFVRSTSNTNITGQDHNSIHMKINVDREVFNPQIIFYRDIDSVDASEFEMLFGSANLHELYNEDRDSTRAANILTHRIMYVLNMVCPMKRVVKRENSNPWFEQDMRVYLEDAKAMREVWLASGDEEDRKVWRSWQNWAKNKCRAKRKTWEEKKCNNKDTSVMWKAINEKSKLKVKSSEAIHLKDEKGNLVTNEYAVARMLNNGFKGKVDRLSAELKPNMENMLNYTSEHVDTVEQTYGKWGRFSFRTVGTGEIAKIIRRLKNTGSQGTDGICTKVIKKFVNCLAAPIRHVVNVAIRTAAFPSCWKTGIITPLFKGGDKYDPGQYRPVNVLPALSKCLEKVLNFQLTKFFEDSKLYSNSQHAYRSHRSCSTAIMDVDTIVNKARAEGKHVSILSTDMSSAFDLVDKRLLLPKLKMFGFLDSAVKMLENYLSDRKACVKVGKAISDIIPLRLGVGQGTCLGPQVFGILFVDLPVVARRVQEEVRTAEKEEDRCVDAELFTVEFADDGTGVNKCTGEYKNEMITNKHCTGLYSYYEDSGMKINPKKSNVIYIRPRPKPPDARKLKLGDQDESEFLRLLGVWLDNRWNFSVHLKKTKEKLNFTLGNLSSTRHLVSQRNMNIVTRAYVHQSITFCGEVWLQRKDVMKGAQKILNNAARLVLFGKQKFEGQAEAHVVEMNRKLKWRNVENMSRELLIKIFFKIKYRKFVAPVTIGEFRKAQITDESAEMLRHPPPRTCWPKAKRKLPTESAAVNRMVTLINDLKLHINFYPEKTTRTGMQVFSKDELDSEISRCLSRYDNGNLY